MCQCKSKPTFRGEKECPTIARPRNFSDLLYKFPDGVGQVKGVELKLNINKRNPSDPGSPEVAFDFKEGCRGEGQRAGEGRNN